MSLSIRSQLANTNPYFAWAVQYILDYAERSGAQFTITSVNRTAEQQWELYRDFNSKAVEPGCSQHQYGAAVDVDFVRDDWQRWWQASARNFGLTTVRGDDVHAQLVPGAQFREWAVRRGFCPDPVYRSPIQMFDSADNWRNCLLDILRRNRAGDKSGGSCPLPCGPVYGIPC